MTQFLHEDQLLDKSQSNIKPNTQPNERIIHTGKNTRQKQT